MLRYQLFLSACASQPWALEPGFLATAVALLSSRSMGLDSPATEARAISDARAKEVARAEGGVAVMPVMGVIAQRISAMDEACGGGGTSIERAQATFRQLRDSDEVKAIVMQFDTPGGGTFGVEEFAAEIREARGIKPIIAQVDSLMASAGYWLGSAADEIVVTPGGMAGSIGVYSVHKDLSAAFAKAGINPTLIRDGEFKAETNPFGPLTEAGEAILTAMVTEAGAAFRESVAAGRNVSVKAVKEKFGDGKVFGAKELVDRGMADRVGTLSETLARFGVPTKRRAAAASSRQAFARGDVPSMRDLEAALGDLGLSNAQAERFVSHGYQALAPGEPAPDQDEAARKALAGLSGYKFTL